MVRVRLISKEEAQNTRKSKAPGVRRQRMNQFDEYAQAALENPEQAVVYEDLGENPQKFVLSLRGAFKRAGANASVRKMRGRDEVRVWLVDEPTPPSPRRGRAAR
jgi:cell division septation protein DedD